MLLQNQFYIICYRADPIFWAVQFRRPCSSEHRGQRCIGNCRNSSHSFLDFRPHAICLPSQSEILDQPKREHLKVNNPFELILKYFKLDRMLSIFKTFVIIFSYGNIGFKLWDLNRYYLNSFADLANLIFSLFTNSRRGNRTNSPGLVSLLTFKCNWFIVQLVPSIKKAHGSGGEESIFDS